MRIFIQNIRKLSGILQSSIQRISGKEMDTVTSIDNAWLIADNGIIESYGSMDALPDTNADEIIDATGSLVLPTWCDSHTHIVFAAPRDGEFVDRIRGLSYEEIARKGGGILNSANKLNEMSEDELYEQSLQRVYNVMSQGTGAVEIKSGYGLNTDAELKMLRVIRRIKENVTIPVKASFLAAHAYPLEFRQNKAAYISLIIDEMLPLVAGEGLADYIDAFCEEGFFSVDDTARIMEAGAKYGLKPKIHANQLHFSGGVQIGVAHNAVSVDHLECVGEAEIAALKVSRTIPTLLPGAAYFLGMHYPPARLMIDAGLPLCLASDYNPGTCPSGNMPLLMSIACTQMKMTPNEAFNAMTINGAAALELEGCLGSITIGKKANLIITKHMHDITYIPYDYGNNPVKRLIVGM